MIHSFRWDAKGAAVCLMAAALLFSCKFDGVKRKVDKIEGRIVQIGAGTGGGMLLTIVLPVPIATAFGICLIASVVTVIFEDDPISVTVESGGTLNIGQAVERLQSDLKLARDEKVDADAKWSAIVRRWVVRFAWTCVLVVVGWLFYRWEWLRKAFVRRAGEAHSKFWSFIHALVPGEATRKRAERK